VGAAVVLGDDLDILVLVAAMELIFDPEIGEVDLAVEVRQLVFGGPALNLAMIAVRPPIAIGMAAIGLPQPLLILALELLVEDDAVDVGALLAQALRFTQLRTIQLRIMGHLAASGSRRPQTFAHARRGHRSGAAPGGGARGR
jgi:hypothetical protein